VNPSSPAIIKLPALAAVVGTVAGVLGIGLLKLIALITNLSFHGRVSVHEATADFSTLGMIAILVPAAGGLLIGLIARFGSPEVRGHGIPETMQGVMVNQSRIPLRVALLKPLASALSIGTGGPFGAEGPVIATGGGIGSLFGQWLPCSALDRKILLASGAAAGLTAAFGTPLAGVLLAIELLVFEFRSRSFLPVAIAAASAMAVRCAFAEPLPMLPLPGFVLPDFPICCGALVVGCVTGLAAVMLTHSLHFIEHQFEKLPLPWMWWPALGGLAVGIIGWLDPRTLGPGYFNLHGLLEGNITVAALLTLGIFKFLSWTICLGSGTSGGTVAPVMTIGGVVGCLVAIGLDQSGVFPGLPPGLAALVGMTAIFAGVSRAFLTSVAFGVEATHAPSAAAPLLFGCAAAVLVSRIFLRETMMTEKLARKGVTVPSDYEPDVLKGIRVSIAMNPHPLTIPPETMVSDLATKMIGHDPAWNSPRLFPIVNENGTLLGIISRADVMASIETAPDANVLDAGIENPVTIHPDETLDEAANRMIRRGVGRLPVVDRSNSQRFCGLLTRHEILQARQHRLGEE
jgi:H+/Cl- antiporter ClcA/CBS domain-containing protein